MFKFGLKKKRNKKIMTYLTVTLLAIMVVYSLGSPSPSVNNRNTKPLVADEQSVEDTLEIDYTDSKLEMYKRSMPNCSCTCNCPKTKLTVVISLATNLPDKDCNYTNDTSDPFVVVTAKECNGDKSVEMTSVIWNEENPIWNEVLDFGCGKWKSFTIKVYDEDGANDEILIGCETINVCNKEGTFARSVADGTAKLYFNYYVFPQ